MLARHAVQRVRSACLAPSEIMTILIHFYRSHYLDFKAYYTQHAMTHLRSELPASVSYNRFAEFTPTVIIPLLAYLQQRRGVSSGMAFVDATTIKACHNKRILRNKVFAGLAKRGKSTMSWFYGFKLHLIVNDQGEVRPSI